MKITKGNGGNTVMSFQDELKRNMRSPETAINASIQFEAKQTIDNIKKELMACVKLGKYTTQNGVTMVTCYYGISLHRLRSSYENNGEAIRRDSKRFFLFREAGLVYRTWWEYDIKPQYSTEHAQFMTALKQLAAEENIRVECGIHTPKDGRFYSLPAKIDSLYADRASFCIHAWTIV